MTADRDSHLITYRLEQADDALEQANLLYTHGHKNGAINRTYYAMFYAVQALIVKRGIDISKHGGVIAFFDRYIVKEQKVDKNFSKWLHWLFDLRQDADYGTTFSPTDDQTKEAIAFANKFISEIKNRFNEL